MKKKTEFLKKVFGNKKYTVTLLLTAAALILVLLSAVGKTERTTSETDLAIGVLSEQLENKICEMCERVDGVGNVYVMLTLDTSQEYVYAENTEKSDTYVKSQFVTADSGGGVELYIVCPKVRGVAVVCDGGDRGVIQKTLSELISSALGIPISNISVAGT